MKKVYGLWYGGSSYSVPDVSRDTESFDSLEEAQRAFHCRYENECDPATPCVNEEAWMHVFFSDPRKMDDPYPDRILKFGPRGGVITELA